MDVSISPPRRARFVAGARRKSGRHTLATMPVCDVSPVPLMAAAAATFGSGPDLSHDPAAGNPNVYTTFTVAVTSTDDPTATATSTPGTSVATSATFVTATASTATAEHVGGFQFVDGDEAMYLGPIDHDFIKAQFVTITSTSVALAGDRAFVVHDILISGKALDAVPRHRLRRLGKMPASVVKKVSPAITSSTVGPQNAACDR